MSLTELFGEVIYAYTREQALDDGVQVDANIGDFAEVSRQHYRYPVYMTAAVFGLIERAVANSKHCNDFKGIWHDVLYMSRRDPSRRQWQTGCEFTVIITGAGRSKYHRMKIECGPRGLTIDDGEPAMLVSMADED